MVLRKLLKIMPPAGESAVFLRGVSAAVLTVFLFAGLGLWTGVLAAAGAEISAEAQEGSSAGTEITGRSNDGNSFEDALDALYRDSSEMTDEEILAAAAAIRSDGAALYGSLSSEAAGHIMEVITAYEESKAKYLADRINGSGAEPGAVCGETAVEHPTVRIKGSRAAPGAVCGEADAEYSPARIDGSGTEPGTVCGKADGEHSSAKAGASAAEGAEGASESGNLQAESSESRFFGEWEKQASYTERMITQGAAIRSMIPRFKVISLSGLSSGQNICGETVGIRLEEWMTQGYGEPDGSGPVNASAYSYCFSLILEGDGDGGWSILTAGDTDENFAWLQEREDTAAGDLMAAVDPDLPDEAVGAAGPDLPEEAVGAAGPELPDEAVGAATSDLPEEAVGAADPDLPEEAVGAAGPDLSDEVIGSAESAESAAAGGEDGENLDNQESLRPGAESAVPENTFAVLSDAGEGTAAYARLRADAAAGRIFETAEAEEASSDGGSREEGILFSSAAEGDERILEVSSHYSYSPSKAASYADKYWKHYNHHYVEYRGVDCANFVSQCLYAGGMPKTGDWFPQSVNWINVMGHIRHFKNYGMFLTASDYSVSKGNPVYYDWNSNGTYDHTAICVGNNSSGTPIVDAHTNDVYHVPWRMGSGGRRGTIRLPGTGGNSGKKNCWETSHGKIYYIGSDGKRVKNCFLTIGGERYYFKSSGARASGFFEVHSKWYYASVKDGRLLRRWQNIAGKTYFFRTDYSRIPSGIHTINGATYCFSSTGYRFTGFFKYKSRWYYGDRTTGKLAKGWKKIGGKWYFFDRKAFVRASGRRTIDGSVCYFSSDGVLIRGKHG